jgi:multidrug resistance efflux pump
MEEKAKKINKRTLTLFIGVIVAIAAVGGLWWWLNAGRTVSTDDARVKGTIVTVSSKVPGRIEKILVNEGDSVEAGQVIARIESSDLEAQVAQAKANLSAAQAKLAGIKAGNRPQQVAQAEAAVQQAAANLDNAQKNYERIESLYEQGGVSAQQRDAGQTALEVAKAQYDAATQNYSLTAEGARPEDIQAAQAQVDQAAAALKTIQLQLDNVDIKAPVAGTIAVKSAEIGEIVAAGQPLFNITDLQDIWVAANIEETYIGRVLVGQPVEFSIDAYPGKTFHGEVSEVGAASASQFALLPTENSSGNFTKVTQRLPIKVRVTDGSNYALKPGMSAVINIHVR